VGWPFETTPSERKRERKSGYEHGLKGNSVGTNWSGKEYRKGAEAGYQKYCDNKKKQEEERNNSKRSSSKSYSSNKKTSYKSYSCGYSGGGYSEPMTTTQILVTIGVIGSIILFIIISISNYQKEEIRKAAEYEQMKPVREAAKRKEELEIERTIRNDLPARLKVSDVNFSENVGLVGGGLSVSFNENPHPDTKFHIYSKSRGDSSWAEIPIKSFFVQNIDNASKIFRVILFTEGFVVPSSNERVIISWDAAPPESATVEQSQERSAEHPSVENSPPVNYTPPQSSYQQRQNKNIAKDVDPSGL